MLLLAETENATILLLVTLVVISLILLMRSNRYFRRRTILEIPRPSQARARAFDPRREVDHWQVEMHELGRDMIGQIDTKMTALAMLIRKADEASERLEGLVAKESSDIVRPEPRPAKVAEAPRLRITGSPVEDAFEASYFPEPEGNARRSARS